MNQPAEGMSPERISRMIAEGIASEIMRTVDCKLHHGKPIVTIVQAEADGLEYAISGCCDDLRKRTRRAIDDLLGCGLAASA
jgi:hypothetical protein